MPSQAAHIEKKKRSAGPPVSQEFSSKLAHHLRRLRNARGLSQAEAAERIGIAENTYQVYESAKPEDISNPRLGTLLALADAFEIDIAELLNVTYDAEDDLAGLEALDNDPEYQFKLRRL